MTIRVEVNYSYNIIIPAKPPQVRLHHLISLVDNSTVYEKAITLIHPALEFNVCGQLMSPEYGTVAVYPPL